jgi:hypothetical protein
MWMPLRTTLLAFLCLTGLAAQKYSGPRPAKPDVPYLVHADNLVETVVTEAKEEKRKQDVAYVVAGASSTARTPLAGPAFIFQAEQIQADKLQLYRFEVKNGNREVVTSHKGKAVVQPRRINVSPLGGGLFKIEVDEHLDNGEYGFTPEGSNQVFCFQVY